MLNQFTISENDWKFKNKRNQLIHNLRILGVTKISQVDEIVLEICKTNKEFSRSYFEEQKQFI